MRDRRQDDGLALLGRSEDVAIRETAQGGADERTDPVDVPVVEVARYHGWSEVTRGVHGCPGERSADEDVGRDDEPDAEAGDPWRVRRNGRPEDRPHEEQREHRFDEDREARADG